MDTNKLLSLMDEILEEKTPELNGEPLKKEISNNSPIKEKNGSGLDFGPKFDRFHTWRWSQKNDPDLGTTIELQLDDYGDHIQRVFINTMNYIEDYFPEDSEVNISPNTLFGIIFIDFGRLLTDNDKSLLTGLKQNLEQKYFISS